MELYRTTFQKSVKVRVHMARITRKHVTSDFRSLSAFVWAAHLTQKQESVLQRRAPSNITQVSVKVNGYLDVVSSANF
jgi:hypothetical protein